MPALPAATALTDAAVTEGQFKTALTGLRGFLAGLLGTDGNVATALAAMMTLFGPGVAAKTGAYTVATGDRGKLFDCSGTFSLTLPAAATAGAGFSIAVRNSGSGTITLDANGSELVNGAPTADITAGSSAIVICTGAAWLTVGQSTPITFPIPIARGGTGATDAATAAANLSVVKRDNGSQAIGTMALVRHLDTNVAITPGGTISGASLGLVQWFYNTADGKHYHSYTATSGTWRAMCSLNATKNSIPVFTAQRIA